MKQPVVVLVQLDTDDPLLDPDAIDVSTVEATVELRAAIVRALPGLTSVVAVMSLEEAKLMVRAHATALMGAGLGEVVRPPRGYRQPRRRH